MMKRDIPVYLITGFLESGKTQFLDFTGFSDPVHPPFFLTDSGIDIVERLRHLKQTVGNDTHT